MPKYSIYPLLFLSLLLSVFLMRHSQTSLTSILFTQPLRFLTAQNLTQQFCYGIPETDPYSQSDQERAQGFRNALENFRNDDKTLTGLINDNQPTDTFIHEYGDSLTPILAPWIVFFGISVVFCLGYIINWCCMNYSCCIPCAWKCCLAPKTGASKKFFAVLSIILMFFVVGIAIAGAVFSSRVNIQSNATVCWGLRLLDKIENGSQEDDWIGFSPAVNKIDSIVAGVINAAGGLSDFNTVVEYLSSNITEAMASTNDTETKNELENQQEIATSLANVHDEFLADLQQIEDEIMNIRPLVVQVSEDSSQIQSQTSNHQNLIKDIIKAIEGTFVGLFIANIVFSAVALTSIMFVCCGAKAFNKGVYGTWFMIGFLMLVGWLAATAIFGMTIVVLESCDVGDGALKSSEFFNKTFNYLESAFDIDDSNYNKTRDALYTCIHGDGDLAKEYNLTDTVGIFDQIFDQVDQSLSEVKQIDSQFSSLATQLQTSINSINGTINPIYNKFKGPQGLIDGSNCAYIKQDLVDLIDVTCTGVGSTFFEITVTYLVLSFIAFFGTMMLFCLAKRFTLPDNVSMEQNKPDVPEIYEIEI